MRGSKRFQKSLGLAAVVVMAAALAAIPASAQADPPGKVITVDCATDVYQGTVWITAGQTVTVDQTNCGFAHLYTGSTDPALSGEDDDVPSATFTVPSGTDITLAQSSNASYDQTNEFMVETADPLADPASGNLLFTQDATIPLNPRSFTVPGDVPATQDVPAQHALDGNQDCLMVGGDHVYSTIDVTVSTAGSFTFRVVGTDPLSSYTDPTAANYAINDPLLAVYKDYDPANPDAGVVGCNDDYDNTGESNSYTGAGAASLPDGSIVEGHFPAFSADLTPGHYTLVLTTWDNISVNDWDNGIGNPAVDLADWTPRPQTATFQLWGPAGALEVDAVPVITSAAPDASLTTGTPYTTTVTASGGGTITYGVTGTLPPGLSLDPDTGILSGTPTTTGSYTYEVTATNAVGSSAPVSYTQVVAAPGGSPGSVSWTDTDLGDLFVGVPADSAVSASGAEVVYTLESGTLPDGLTLNADGSITGTPTTAGPYDFTLRASDGSDHADHEFTGTVGDATLALKLNFAAGTAIGDATTTATAEGLQVGSDWTLQLFSTPITIASGVVGPSGVISQLVRLPADTPPGQHHLLLTGIAPSGATLTSEAWFTLGTNGTILAISLTGPTPSLADLAFTGVSNVGGGILLGVLAVLAGGALILVRRRRAHTV
jgi:hypothetical protein